MSCCTNCTFFVIDIIYLATFFNECIYVTSFFSVMGLIKQGWNEIPEVMGAACMAVIGESFIPEYSELIN